MEQRKIEKVTAISVTVIVVSLSLFDTKGWMPYVSIYPCCHIYGRMLYPFFHAGFLHAALNAWCLLCVTFIYDVSWVRMLFAYLVAISFPVDTLAGVLNCSDPTIGLSGVVYAMFGSISFEVSRKWYYQLWMLFYLAIGFSFPNTNAWLHLYCYIIGFMFALLNKPIDK